MEQPITAKNVGQPCVICGQAADAKATIAALQGRVQELEDGTSALLNQQSERLAVENEKLTMALSQITQRTAELEAAKAIQAIDMKNNNAYREQVANLQAELERVRALVKALPKVEGEIRVIEVATDEWHVYDTIFTTKAGADNYAALLQHRQGMEG